ncbi:MAG TPA: acyl-CoA dehydrogenase family protein, partial [Symbiobacteriaceae bacterium]|nr:acyl-CoA dehydrogenase family protein [Symbiobacteriaceae bacterium]
LHRALIPIAKARAGDKVLQIARAGLESFGGNGYIEEYVMARLLRDAQVLTVWEGPENVLALDLLRVLAKQGPGDVLAEIERCLAPVSDPDLQPARGLIRSGVDDLQTTISAVATARGDEAQIQAVRLLNHLADLLSAAYLLAEAPGNPHKREIALLYIDRLSPAPPGQVTAFDRAALDRFELIMDGA